VGAYHWQTFIKNIRAMPNAFFVELQNFFDVTYQAELYSRLESEAISKPFRMTWKPDFQLDIPFRISWPRISKRSFRNNRKSLDPLTEMAGSNQN